ncbi:MAG: exonuclease SbcCD subunit D [Clostridiaceae bacterium]
MDSVKILHFADIHFDSPFSELSVNTAEKRKEDLRETFGKAIDLANKEKVDIILLAGDLFDNTTVMKSTLDFMIKKFLDIPKIKVFIAPGNHDPYNTKSFYNLISWPDNVHIFKESYTQVQLHELKTIVHGIGFSASHERESLLKGIKAQDDGAINLMVLHGEISRGGSNDYNPFTPQEIGDSRMDYIALGHKHEFSGILREGSTHYAYSGNIEGRGFDETGEKGAVLGTVSKRGVDLKFVPLQKRKYIVKEIDVTGCSTYEELVFRIKAGKEEGQCDNLYKIVLIGELPEYFRLNLELLASKMKDIFYYVKLVDKTSVSINLESLVDKYTLKGIFAGSMVKAMENMEEDEKELYQEALKLGLQALAGGELRLK